MANLPLGFALTLGGGVLITAGLSGKTLGDVLTGKVSASDVTSAAPAPGTAGNPLTGGSSNPLAPGNPASAPPFTNPFAKTPSALPTSVAASVQQVAKSHGWGPSEITAWLQLIPLESNGTITDTNPSSGAYSIAQFINGPSEYAKYGGNATSVSGQITAMGNYIAQRYGTPSKALAFHTTPASQGGSQDAANPGGWY